VVLADLSVMRQRHWHGQISAALEQVPGELPIEQLAYHASQAGDLERAVIYLERAGDRATAAYAYTEAEGSYRELLGYLEQTGRSLDAARVCEKMGKLLYTSARLDEALGALTQAEAIYRAASDGEGQRRSLALLGQVHAEAGTASQGLQLLLPILKEANPADAPQGWARVYEAVAFLYHEMNHHQESLAAAEQAVALARLAGDDALLVAGLHRYGEALVNLRRIEESVQATSEFLLLAERVGDLRHAGLALGTLAYNASMIQGAFGQSLAYYDRALELSEQVGDRKFVFICLINRGHVNFLLGDWQAARADGERARALHPWKDEHVLTCTPLLHLGWISLAEGRWSEAKELLEQGLAMAERKQFLNGEVVGLAALSERDLLENRPDAAHARLEPFLARASPEQRALLLSLLAWEALLLGEEGQAGALAVQGLALARQMRFILPDALRIQALVHLQQERWEEAEALLEEALDLCDAMPYPYAEAKALYVYGLLHKAKDELEQARGRLQAALAILNRLGERLYATQVEQALAALNH
jgi:tetratricopeptide (TPR) repeat protein